MPHAPLTLCFFTLSCNNIICLWQYRSFLKITFIPFITLYYTGERGARSLVYTNMYLFQFGAKEILLSFLFLALFYYSFSIVSFIYLFIVFCICFNTEDNK
jgi:prepilin signal peptidase PulO-like enzyme (type II secretory pathway)